MSFCFNFKKFLAFFILIKLALSQNTLKPLKSSEDYKFSLNADDQDENLYKLYWKLIDKNQQIQFEIHCKTIGWVGLGLSPNGGMTNSDIAIGWVDSNGKGYLKDTHAIGKSTPLIDQEQNWFLINSTEINGYTVLKIKRKLQTCDKNKQDIDIKFETQRLIFAWGSSDPRTGLNDWSYHFANRRIKSAILLNVLDETNSSNTDHEVTKTYELRLNQHPLPGKDTYYYCKLFELPPHDEDLHLISYDVLIDKESIELVHHFDVYICEPDDVNQINNNTKNIGYDCGPGGDESEQDILKNICTKRTMIFAWAVGGKKTVNFPENVGFRIPKSKSPTLIFVNYHFDNSRLINNVKDNSGLRFKLTKNLRKYDLGILTIAVPTDPFTIQIPPNSDNIKLSSYCYSNCTEKFLPDEGITVFAGNFHTHLQGRALRTSLIRNGKLIKYLFEDENYDFNYQTNMQIEPTKLYKGDTLILDCFYSTKDKNEFTFGGQRSVDEMCGNFIYYYPKASIGGCISRFDQNDFVNFYQDLVKEKLMAPFEMNTIKNNTELFLNHLKSSVKPGEKLNLKYKMFYENTVNQMGFCRGSDKTKQLAFNISYVRPKDDLKVGDTCKN